MGGHKQLLRGAQAVGRGGGAARSDGAGPKPFYLSNLYL